MNSIFYYGKTSFPANYNWTFSPLPTNRLYYINEGEGFYHLKNEKYIFKNNHIYLIPQHLKITPGFNRESGFDHTFIDYFSSDTFASSEVISIWAEETTLLKTSFDTLTALILDIKQNKSSAIPDATYINTMHSLLDLILNIMKKSYNLSCITDERIAQAMYFIQNNHMNDITITDIANHVHLDKFYFTRLFKKNTNITPYQYLKQYRLSIGINMVMSGFSVTNAAEKSGYDSIYTFSKAIKKHTGIPPSQL